MIRPFVPDADLDDVAALWEEALTPWPVLPGGLDLLHTGYVAEQDRRMVGMIGIDAPGPDASILFLAVAPGQQRHGIGTDLVGRALEHLRDNGTKTVTIGSGTFHYIWPGIPTDLPEALAFFTAAGWPELYIATDLMLDLQNARAAESLAKVDPPSQVELVVADETMTPAALEFEDQRFPEWSRAFRESGAEVLVAREANGDILGTLLFDGPGQASPYWPILGEDSATIACVGVAPDNEGRGIGSAMVAEASQLLHKRGARNCHIDWVVRVDFYRRLGYEPWRTFSMRTNNLADLPS